ncbi:MAG TPA: hypothetical protein VM143_01480 [Acidimicrobiales bacterium]|nr:hypothetical protein [Acidimicrobiales bacterium]
MLRREERPGELVRLKAAATPSGYDVLTAEPVFLGGVGVVDEVTRAYLKDRFPDYPSPGIKVDTARTRGRRAFARWEVADALAAGTLFLRQGEAGWDVIASTTDGIDLTGLRVEPGRVRGEARTTNINSMFADVLLLDGTPVPGAPRPDGQPGAEYRYATAAGPANDAVHIDVVIPSQAVLRVGLVGGTILALSELRLS